MRTLVAASFLLALFAGCLANDEPTTSSEPVNSCPDELFAGPALYNDPQNAPHPLYNWPTVSNPAVGCAPALWKPIPAANLTENIQALVHVVQTPGVTSGAGIALFGSIAVVPGFGAKTSFVNISDPANPVVMSQVEPTDPKSGEGLSHRGATIIAYPSGRLVTAISTDTVIDLWDISDPKAPVQLAPLRPEFGSHKVGVIPGTPIIYNAHSTGGSTPVAGLPVAGPGNVDPSMGTAVMEMWDLEDADAPVQLDSFQNGYACHHVYFWNNVEEQKFRGICAGVEYTQIFDTADPKKPELIVSVPYGYGMAGGPSGSASIAAFSHYAGLSVDGKILLVGDESGGGLGPAGCIARADTPEGAASVPNGAVWFYDVSDEENPTLKGWISASQLERMGAENVDPNGVTASCTAHHGRMIPVPGKDVLAMSFYGAGVIVIDYTAVRGEVVGLPSVLAQYSDASNTWETWYYNGYIFTGDLNRGMDVLTLA